MARGTAGRGGGPWPRCLPPLPFLVGNRTAASSPRQEPSTVHRRFQLSDHLHNHGMATSQHLSASERASGLSPASTPRRHHPSRGLRRQSKALAPPTSAPRTVSLAPQSLAMGSGLMPCPQLPRLSAGRLAGLSPHLPLRCSLLFPFCPTWGTPLLVCTFSWAISSTHTLLNGRGAQDCHV